MGLLVDGIWRDAWYDTKATDGRFVRTKTSFRNWITKSGDAGPTGHGGFSAQAARYHLVVSHACPWCHRVVMARALKGLESTVSLSVVHPYMGEQGWSFDQGPSVIPEPFYGTRYAHELYTRAEPNYTGRVTVPILWDTQTDTMVSNESADILRMFNAAFEDWANHDLDLYPEALREPIERWNSTIYSSLNNGVYRAGFSTTQPAYEEAVSEVFTTLDILEAHLASKQTPPSNMVGQQLTETDLRLFATLVRFDPVYVGHFKCNKKRLSDYPHLWVYTRKLHQMPLIKKTVYMLHIKEHYYTSHPTINPSRIVPVGPELDFDAPPLDL